MLKKIAALAASLFVAGAAQAAAPSDGIYFNPATGGYTSVHTNGNQILVIGLNMIPATGVQLTSALGVVQPSQLNTWDLASGTTDGTNATVSGTTLYGACNVTFAITVGGNMATARVLNASQTIIGQQSRINCAGILGSPTATLFKAF